MAPSKSMKNHEKKIFSLAVPTLAGTLPPMSEDYGVSKAPTMSHQSLPAFTRFPRYSPPYSSHQTNTEVAASWPSYAPAAESALSSQYTVAAVTSTAGRGRQSSAAVATSAPSHVQPQFTAASSLAASEFCFFFITFFVGADETCS